MTLHDDLARIATIQNVTPAEILADLTAVDVESAYGDYLDEQFSPLEICGYEYAPSNAFMRVDPTAYKCDYADWLDAQCENEFYFPGEYGEYYYYAEVCDLVEELDKLEDNKQTEN